MGTCVGVIGCPNTGATSFALTIARHARWRGHFNSGVFFIPWGDIATALREDELGPDGDFEPFEVEGLQLARKDAARHELRQPEICSFAGVPLASAKPTEMAERSSPGAASEDSDPEHCLGAAAGGGGIEEHREDPSCGGTSEGERYLALMAHRLLRRTKGCICAGILRHLARLQETTWTSAKHEEIRKWINRYLRVRAC